MPAEFLNNLYSRYYGSSAFFNKDVTIYSNLTGLANALIVGETVINGDLSVITNTNPLTGKPIIPNIIGDGNITMKLDAVIGGSITAGEKVISPKFIGDLTGNVNGVASGNKTLASFDIQHITQPNKRIRHIVAEGPEPGIYIRGKLKGSNIIELPEYWIGLVDPETITVSLTQIGHSQDLFVESIEWGRRVKIKSGNSTEINCYYEVWAARWLNPMNHEEKLQVVYEGETPDDYPDGNQNFLIGGWDYDRRNPRWGA